jgi:DNA-binding NarL/FixJ family response regulator
VELTMARPTLKPPKAETYLAALDRSLELAGLSLVVCDTAWRVLSTHNTPTLIRVGDLVPEFARLLSRRGEAQPSGQRVQLEGGRSVRALEVDRAPEHRVFVWLRHDDEDPLSADASQVLRKRYGLSVRAQQLLKLLAQGLSNRAIAQELGLREATVKTYLHELYEALGVRSRTAAIAQVRSSIPPANSTDFR